ncbi:hypothetical protein E1A91_A03G223800v1 [Gossypium mustelinum]|uniref:J domain-containing protein n=1 Tax=Gossypium mustelinum TaxID=34275 RepID=A0A5D3A1D1_GOSMU|nr:hypothetical protein E1A91_A03G223800v1 [Gossypium mustelinum]
MASSVSVYEVLGVPVSANGNEIKAAYRRLARTWHPDVVSVNQKEMSADRFMRIHAAYSTLSDPNQRADYDRNLRRWNRPFTTMEATATAVGSYGFSSYGGNRNWETDQCW